MLSLTDTLEMVTCAGQFSGSGVSRIQVLFICFLYYHQHVNYSSYGQKNGHSSARHCFYNNVQTLKDREILPFEHF